MTNERECCREWDGMAILFVYWFYDYQINNYHLSNFNVIVGDASLGSLCHSSKPTHSMPKLDPFTTERDSCA